MTLERKSSGAAAAAAAMDALDAADASAEAPEAPEAPEAADAVDRYRALPAMTAEQLAEHVRGGERIIDGQTHQAWGWTNADVARCVRPMVAERFPDLPAGRELADDQGFDDEGNRLLSDVVVARAGDRFNDVVRELDGSRRFGSGRGLETAEIQLLRTRFHRLTVDEATRVRSAQAQRRFDRRVGLYVALLLLVVVVVVAGFLVDFLQSA